MLVNIHEAKTQFSKLIERAIAGEEVIVARNGHPLVRLTPVVSEMPVRSPGKWKGQVRISSDFDELPVDVMEAFGMTTEVGQTLR